MEDAVIVSAVRTPVGSFGGYFKDVPATELGTHAIKAALERAGVAPDEVEEVILGCVLQAGLGPEPGAPGRHGRRHPEGGAGHDDQHAVRLGPQVGRHRLADDPGGRRRRRRRGRHGEHVARAVPDARRPLRRAHGRHEDHRLDDARRPDRTPSTTSTWASPRRTWPTSTTSAARSRTSSPPPASRRPSARSRTAPSRRRSSRSRSRSGRAPASSTRTSTRGPASRPRGSASCARRSARTAAP